MPGDEIIALPSGRKARVSNILTADGDIAVALTDMAVTLLLDTEIDISRGDLISGADDAPVLRRDLDAEVCWFDTTPLDPARPYLIKHGGTTVRAKFVALRHRVDVDTLRLDEHPLSMSMNEIASVQLRVQRPIAFDAYRDNRATGAFILIDEASNHTVAAGTIS